MMRSCLAVALAAILLSATLATTPASARAADKPTVVLVHGAFADASGFGAVTSRSSVAAIRDLAGQPAPWPGERRRLCGERHAHARVSSGGTSAPHRLAAAGVELRFARQATAARSAALKWPRPWPRFR